MQIDESVEEHVRDALGAAIDRDGDAMVAAFDGLSAAKMQHSLGLGLFAIGYVVNEIHQGNPSSDDIVSLAQQIVESEADWISLNLEAIRRLLYAASKGDASLAGVKPDDAMALTVVTGAHLLAAFRADKESWYEYLDEIWAALLASPENSGE